MVPRRANNSAFTIIELMIVVVVIGILAAIIIVSYSQVTSNARIATLRADLTQASGDLQKEKSENGSYPATQAEAIALLKASTGVSYQYTYNTTTQKYCLTGTLNDKSYWVDSDRVESVAGGCAGHGQGGLSAITNIAKNPKGAGAAGQYASSGWFTSYCGADATDTAGVSWNSRTWHRMAWTGSGCSTMRMALDLSDLQSGQTYRVSADVANSGSSPVTFTMDFCDQGTTSTTLSAGQTSRVSFTASRSVYDTNYRFVDINVSTAGTSGVLITNVIVTQGTSTYNYGDGDSPNWIWNGTSAASTSTGPQL